MSATTDTNISDAGFIRELEVFSRGLLRGHSNSILATFADPLGPSNTADPNLQDLEDVGETIGAVLGHVETVGITTAGPVLKGVFSEKANPEGLSPTNVKLYEFGQSIRGLGKTTSNKIDYTAKKTFQIAYDAGVSLGEKLGLEFVEANPKVMKKIDAAHFAQFTEILKATALGGVGVLGMLNQKNETPNGNNMEETWTEPKKDNMEQTWTEELKTQPCKNIPDIPKI